MNNRYEKYVLFAFIVILVSVYLYCYAYNQTISSSKNGSSGNLVQSAINIKADNLKQAKAALNEIGVTKERKSALVVNSDVFEEDFFGYGKEVNAKLNSKDPRVTVSLYEYPEGEREELKEELQKLKRLGYTEVSNYFITREVNISDSIYSISDPQENASFKLSKLPDELSSNYIGYVIEDAPPIIPTGFKSNAIRKVFNIEGMIFSLEESSAENGTSHFTKEFVTDYIGEYPAVMTTLKREDKQFEQLIWDTDTYRYALYGIGQRPIAEIRSRLLEYAKVITALNT